MIEFKSLDEFKALVEGDLKAKKELERSDLVNCLFYAFRYSLNRKTYSSLVVQSTIKAHESLFKLADFMQIKREIEEADRVGTDDWFQFHEWLKKKIDAMELEKANKFSTKI